MSAQNNLSLSGSKKLESYVNEPSNSEATSGLSKTISGDNCDQVECAIVEVSELLGFLEPFVAKLAPTNLPQVDFGTFAPLLGTKFFCFHPSSFSLVTEEINSYLSCEHSGINFDFDEVNHSWKCNETKEFETVTFSISLFESSLQDKIYVKFHRLNGATNVFSDSVARFSRITTMAHSLMTVDPVDMTESCIDSKADGLRSFNPKKRKGAFRALPLPLTVRQKTTTSREFISYCDVFSIWAQSDIQECLSSILTSMPKMWKDLTIFYKAVEDMSALSLSGTEEATKEMIQMFGSMHRVYQNLFCIAISSYHCLHADDDLDVPVAVAAEPVQFVQTVAVPEVVEEPGDSRYAFLDFDDEDVDLSAGRVDDFHFGRDAAAGNYQHREAVTMDITKSGYRSMAVFERSNSRSLQHVSTQVSTKTVTEESHVTTTTSKIVIKQHDVHSLFGKLVAAAAALGVTEAPVHNFTDVLASRSKEDLSKILHLSLACVCHQFSPEHAVTGTSFDVKQYLCSVMGRHTDFGHVLQDLLANEQRPCVRKASEGHGFELFNSKEIAQCAQQLSAATNN